MQRGLGEIDPLFQRFDSRIELAQLVRRIGSQEPERLPLRSDLDPIVQQPQGGGRFLALQVDPPERLVNPRVLRRHPPEADQGSLGSLPLLRADCGQTQPHEHLGIRRGDLRKPPERVRQRCPILA